AAVRDRMSLRKTDPDPSTSASAAAQQHVTKRVPRFSSGHTVPHRAAGRRVGTANAAVAARESVRRRSCQRVDDNDIDWPPDGLKSEPELFRQRSEDGGALVDARIAGLHPA